MAKNKGVARRSEPDPNRPDPAVMLAVVRLTKGFELANTAVIGLVVVACFGVLYAILGRVEWNTTTVFDFNFGINIAITAALTVAVSGSAIGYGRREKKRGDRLAARNEALEQKVQVAEDRADRAERRADDLAGDLDRLRGRSE